MLLHEPGVLALLGHVARHVSLTHEEKMMVADHFAERTLPKNDLLLSAGNICRQEYFVVSGFLRMFYTDDKATDHTLRFAAEGWWISDVESFLHNRPSVYSIESMEQSTVLQINQSSLTVLFDKVPLFERYFHILHQQAFIAQSRRILSGISEDGITRYLAFRETFGAWHERIPQKYIASYLGITPVFLSRIRKRLSQKS